jgi:uncharacterized Zn-binding protein involved in type VI secretion
MHKFLKLQLIAGLASATLTTGASAAIFGGDGLDIKKFCETAAPRQTVAYIDTRILIDGDQRWAEQLMSKLTSSLMPSEVVTLVGLDTERGQSTEVWSGCYPDYSPERLETLKKEGGGFFSGDPVKALKEQQGLFKTQLGAALGKLLTDNMRPAQAVEINPAAPPQKQIIRALASDEARLENRTGENRVILYSDMIENSDLGMALTAKDKAGEAAASTLGLNLQNASLYAYGALSTLKSRGPEAEKAEKYWAGFFHSADAQLIAFAPELGMSASTPVEALHYEISVSVAGNQRLGRMSLFVDRNGAVHDSYITLSSSGRSYIKGGTFLCKGETCQLEGETPEPVVTTDGHAMLKAGGTRDALKGQLSLEGAKLPDGSPATFAMTAKLILQ